MFHDANGVLHQLILSMAELEGNGDSVRQTLLEQWFGFHRIKWLGGFSTVF